MPVSGSLLVSDADIKVKRSPSLRSEQSSVSESRQVRFNQDVSVKRIPKKVVKTKSLPLEAKDEFSGKCQQFSNLPPPASEQEIASEAEAILRHLEEIQCSVSSSPTARASSPSRPVTSPTPPSQAGSVGNLSQRSNSRHNTLEKKRAVSGSRRDLAMRVEGHSEIEDSPRAGDRDDARYYGLQALSNLDSKVNGDNKLNNHNYRNQQAANEYSVPVKKNNITPPKPPRKAPSASPPSIRRGYMSHDELDFKNRRSELFDPTDSGMETGGPYSYTERNPSLGHVREPQGTMRQSPGRGQAPGQGGNHTDSEILNSPTQVLYATISADKHKHGGNLKNHYMANSASQTIHSGFRPISADRHLQSRTMSKENILDEPPYRPQTAGKHGTRSLERFVDDDKENFKRRQEMKARIHVSSPIRMSPERQSNGHSNGTAARKPYRTTINTATDTIQYNGFNRENLRRTKVDNEHYKVPRNKAPVPPEFMTSRRMEADHHNGPRAKSVGGGSSKGQFSSASLVRNAERRGNNGHAVTRGAGSRGGEFDREGRRIHQERNRAYSGYSTSPDRELSPDRYAKPRPGGHSRSLVRRSPSTSPTRPPRTKSSPSREVHIPVRREHSGRLVERTPSTRASATSRSPIKKIQRVHNEIIGDTGGYREPSPTKSRTLTLRRNQDKGARGTKTLLMNKPVNNKQPEVADDRLSRFTEYRGTSEEPRSALAQSRRSSTGYDLRKNSDSSGGQFERDRERGQSVPPGANIDSMKDFYKTNQYRSMYHLPPSPSRPAPVLQRERSSDQMVAPPRRSKTSVSEGEITDGDGVRVATMNRANKFLNIIPGRRSSREEAQHRDTGASAATLSRRLGSGDRDRNQIYGELNGRRVASKERPMRRPAPQPPGHKVRRSSVDVLETSHSESESPRPEQLRLYSEEDHEDLDWTEPLTRHRVTVSHKGPRSHVSHVSHVSSARGNGHVLYLDSLDTLPHPRYQTKLAGVPVHSDMDSDYRRDMIAGSVHMEARTRDGGHGGPGVAPPSIYQQAASLNRDKSVSKGRLDIRGRSEDRGPRTREVEISQDDDEDEVVSRAPIPLSREEERRKILELERRSGGGQQRTASVSRSGSRVSSKLMPGNKGPKSVAQRLLNTETENESQYSGHSAASVKRPVGQRYNTGPGNRIKRTGSSATTSSARQVISRKKMPGSVTSSVNSSESENGQSAISRATNQSAVSNRSVFLHATAVADIPSAKPGTNGAPGLGETKQFGGSSNLQKSKKISRSISLLAPFKKQQSSRNGVVGGPEKEVIYDSAGQIVQPGSGSGKPPRAPPASRKSPGELQSIMTSRDKKFSASSSDLLDNEAEVMSSPEDVQVARSQIIAASNNSKNQGKVSRSVSMPKDTRLAGWFKKRKRV